jgi:hypothetical protein
MKRLSRNILLFAILFAVFIMTPAFLSGQFGGYPLLKNGDILDLFTPLVLIPLYWLLFDFDPGHRPTWVETIGFLALAGLWVEGQGIHLAGNAIGHLLQDSNEADLATLVYFLDEVLSHYMWHAAIIGLSALLVLRGWRRPFSGERSGLGFEIAAGLIHGFNIFTASVEGATTPLVLPYTLLVVVMGLAFGRSQFRQQPLLAFFWIAFLTAGILFLGWGLYWGGFPEFSQVGLID